MNIILAIYLFLSAIVLVLLAVIGWRRRANRSCQLFAWLSASIGFFVACYGLELTQNRLDILKLILQLEWFASSYIIAFWLLFSVEWSGYTHRISHHVRLLPLIFSTVIFALALTNDYHGLIYSSLWLDTSGAFPLLAVQNGPLYWVIYAYTNACLFITNLIFFQRFKTSHNVYRRQAFVMMLASVIPSITEIGFNLGIGHGVYITSFSLSISAFLFAWGVFHQKLLRGVPVARRELVEMMQDPVLVFDEEDRLVDYNRAAFHLFGIPCDHSAVVNRGSITHDHPGLAEVLNKAEHNENAIFHTPERVFSLSLTVLDPTLKKSLIICLFHDITAQSKAEKRLQSVNLSLEERIAKEVEMNRVKDQALARQARIAAMGEMVAAIAHQWRQPLAILSMIVQDFYASALLGEVPTPTEWDDFKISAMKQIQHMSQTIEEFRNFQRPDHGSVRFSLVQCMEESLRLSSAQFKEHQIINELHVPPDASPCCFGSPSQLVQALLSLLVNAKEAIEDARASNRESLKNGVVIMSLAEAGEWVNITVADNGIGVPDALRDKIFEPYITSKEERGGSGLGLYIAKMLIENGFCGKLRFSSSDEWTCFIVALPLMPGDVS